MSRSTLLATLTVLLSLALAAAAGAWEGDVVRGVRTIAEVIET